MHDASSPHVYVILHCIVLHILLKNTLSNIFLLTEMMVYSALTPFVSHLINVQYQFSLPLVT